MRAFLLLSTMIVVSSIVAETNAEPVLLASFSAEGSFGHSPTAVPEVRFDLELIPNDVDPPGPRLVDPMFRGEGDTWSVDFTRDNSSAFADFADLATNGINDQYGQGIRWFDGAGGIAGGTEMGLFNQFSTEPVEPPDLAGNELEFVRLNVHDVAFEPWSLLPGEDGFMVHFDLTYEFYGKPVPEPGAALLLALGAFLARRDTRYPVAATPRDIYTERLES